MSLDQARAFIEKMKSDEAFRNRIMAIEDVAERFVLIKNEGFDCSEVEIKELAGELSDDELDKAAGGAYKDFFPVNSYTHDPACLPLNLVTCAI